MIINPEISSKYDVIEIHVCKNVSDAEVKSTLETLHTVFDKTIKAVDERGNVCTINPSEVISFYAEGQKVFALKEDGKYSVYMKLYELEEAFGDVFFARISKSELVNVKKIKSLDLSLIGTIRVIMKNGYETYTSRRNVTKLKNILKEQGGRA